MADLDDDPPPFIPTQRLFRLTAPVRERLRWLEPPLFLVRRRWRSETTESESATLVWENADLAGQMGAPDHGWDEVADRAAFLIDPQIRLLCVVDDAGLGKTKTLEQIRYLREVFDRRGHLAIKVEFADLPQRVDDYLGRTPGEAAHGEREPLLMARLRAHPQTKEMSLAEAWELLHRKARQGLLTLLVDALDQTNTGRTGWDARLAAQTLRDFLSAFPQVRCVVSGRPFAVEFQREKLFQGLDWHFAQLDRFTPEEEALFLGTERVAAIKQLEFRSGAVPRDLETIRELPPAELRQVRTHADLYAKCVKAMLAKAREKQAIPLATDRARKLLALLAFETVCGEKTAGIGAELGDPALDNESVDEFVRGIWRRRRAQLVSDGYNTAEDLLEDLGRLAALNVALDPGVLAMPYKTDPTAPRFIWLKFRNRTLQDYFAALWLSKYSSTPKEREWLRTHRHVRGTFGEHHAYAELYEFWRFLAEMPVEVTDHRRWIASLSGLYLRDQAVPPAPRSSEMLYRSWRGMLRRAGLLQRNQTTEHDLAEATARLQRHVLGQDVRGSRTGGVALLLEPNLPKEAKSAARHCLEQFLAEFPAMCLDPHPAITPWRDTGRTWFTGTRPAREIGREFHATWFVPVPAGKFWMGDAQSEYDDEPAHVAERTVPFRMAKLTITNELFALYAPRHPESFHEYERYSSSPRCPAIYVNWYDAWCVATWLHARLPDESEWEGACRAQFWTGGQPEPRPTRYFFGDSERDLDQHAWWSENSGDTTHEVGKAEHKNDLGLYDMLGNVWEWTSTWYAEDPRSAREPMYTAVSRVLRGGAFCNLAVYCRSAYRLRRLPADTSSVEGVRLARAE
jgi:formylglycine-generating enzyme required for sulfatase activity